jgi:thiol-disulfide isomerase/thioredoxin
MYRDSTHMSVYLVRLTCTLAVAWAGVCAAYCQDVAYISGRIQSSGQKEVRFYKINNYLEFQPSILATVTTDATGRFTSTIPLRAAMPVRISYGGDFPMFVWIEKNDSVYIDIKKPYMLVHQRQGSTLDKGNVFFSGRGAGINNYLFAADLMIYDPKTNLTAQERPIKEYWLFLDSMQHARQQLRQTEFPQKFSSQAEAFLLGEIVASTFYHKSMAEAYKTNQTKEDSVVLANPALRTYWLNWKFLPDMALTSDIYRHSLMTYFHQNAREQTKKRPVTNGDREISFASIYREANNELPRFPGTHEYFAAFVLYQMASFVEGRDSLQTLTQHFHQKFPGSTYYPILAKRLQSKVDLTKHAPEIVALDTTNRLFSLYTLKGKPIYIDVWASWCGPCMQELPGSKKIAAKFKDKLHMVYLNISDTEQAWRKVIKKQQLERAGIHLRADKETTQKIRSAYNIGPIPRYILIDKRGMVFRSHAASPADIEQDILNLVE